MECSEQGICLDLNNFVGHILILYFTVETVLRFLLQLYFLIF